MKIAATAAILPVALAGLAACGDAGERTAEAETPVSEAEVTTELPNTVVTDATLNAAAEAAANIVASPPPTVVPVPVPAGEGAQDMQQGTGNEAGAAAQN